MSGNFNIRLLNIDSVPEQDIITNIENRTFHNVIREPNRITNISATSIDHL